MRLSTFPSFNSFTEAWSAFYDVPMTSGNRRGKGKGRKISRQNSEEEESKGRRRENNATCSHHNNPICPGDYP